MTSQSFNLFTASILIATMVGCTLRPNPPPSAQEQHLVHTVKYQGETISLISLWYTGSVRHSDSIQNANPHLRPTKLRAGLILRVPLSIATRTEPLPRTFVQQRPFPAKQLTQPELTVTAPSAAPDMKVRSTESYSSLASTTVDSPRRQQVLQELME